MWFGGDGGLVRYDGHSFASFGPGTDSSSLDSSAVLVMLEGHDDYLWVGTNGGGLARLDSLTGVIKTYRNNPVDGDGLGDKHILSLAMDGQGNLYLGNRDGGIRRLDVGSEVFKTVERPDSGSQAVTSLLVDSQGRIWAGTDGDGLLVLHSDGAEGMVFRNDPGNQDSLGFDHISTIFEDSLGGIWLGLGNGEVDLHAEGSFRHSSPSRETGHQSRAVKALAEDPEGWIWVAFEINGLGSLDPSSLLLDVPDPGYSPGALSLSMDKRGLLWVGMSSGGIRTYNVRSSLFSRYTRLDDGQPLRELRGIAEGLDGLILAGTYGQGLVSIDTMGGSIQSIPGYPGDAYAYLINVVMGAMNGTTWIGTAGGGLISLDRNGIWKRYRHDPEDPSSLPDNSVLSLYEDRDGSILVGTESTGLICYFPQENRFDSGVLVDSLGGIPRGRSISALVKDSRGRFWIGSRDGGVSMLDPGGESFIHFGSDPDTGYTLEDTLVQCISEDGDGSIWVGTGGAGPARFSEGLGRFEHLYDENLPPMATVYGILEDSAGILWFSTSNGLVAYDRELGDFFWYGTEDGLASSESSPSSFIATATGEIWLGGTTGLTRFNPLRVPRYAPQPDVVLTTIEPLGGGIAPSRNPEGTELFLDHDNAGLVFSIAVIDYLASSKNRYAMRLEGHQAGWYFLGHSNTGYLAPLSPGTYRLRVKGANGNGIWNEYGASLSVIVRPPFWGTWWFRTMVLCLLALVLSGGITWKVVSLRRRNALLVQFARHVDAAREEERKMAARDIHDEIGQHLMVLNLHAYWLSSHPEAREQERQSRVKDIQTGILDAMGSVKAVASRLRPTAIDALEFSEALRWYVGSFSRLSGIRTNLDVDRKATVTGDLATALFRIAQELLSNVQRHSGASMVEVSFKVDGDRLVLLVKDNGKGITDTDVSASDSFGIIGMRERCRAFGGTLEIGGQPGKGSIARVRLPIGTNDGEDLHHA